MDIRKKDGYIYLFLSDCKGDISGNLHVALWIVAQLIRWTRVMTILSPARSRERAQDIPPLSDVGYIT